MKRKGKVEIIIGLLLLIAALSLSGYNFYLNMSAEEASNSVLQEIKAGMKIEDPSGASSESEAGETDSNGETKAETEAGAETETVTEAIVYPDYVLNPEMPMPVREIYGLEYVILLDIPSLELELPILSEYVYDNLRVAPCRYAGSIYTNDLVICAHNYRSHFGRLKNMSVGDRVTLTDMDGNVFIYEAREIIVLDPTIIEEFTESGYALTLFTCTYGGASRVTVRCDLVEIREQSPQ